MTSSAELYPKRFRSHTTFTQNESGNVLPPMTFNKIRPASLLEMYGTPWRNTSISSSSTKSCMPADDPLDNACPPHHTDQACCGWRSPPEVQGTPRLSIIVCHAMAFTGLSVGHWPMPCAEPLHEGQFGQSFRVYLRVLQYTNLTFFIRGFICHRCLSRPLSRRPRGQKRLRCVSSS